MCYLCSRYVAIEYYKFPGLLQPSYSSGLAGLGKPGWFFYGSAFPLMSAYKAQRSSGSSISLIELNRESVDPGCLLIRKNSPLTAMLNQGIQALRQTGFLSAAITQWVEKLPQREVPDAEVVEARQAFAGFVCFTTALATVLVILGVEVIVGRRLHFGKEFRARGLIGLLHFG